MQNFHLTQKFWLSVKNAKMKLTNGNICHRIFLLLLLPVVIRKTDALTSDEIVLEWKLFQTRFNKTYKTFGEEQFRSEVFSENRRKIQLHNEAAKAGKYSYTVGLNHFADITDEEFERYLLNPLHGQQKKFPLRSSVSLSESKINGTWIPKQIDWRDQKCVTAVKDQKSCKSCYAFAATGALESHYCLKTKKLVSLSEQNIIDCTDNLLYHNRGCDGGWAENSFIYIVENGGIDTEVTYPYEAMVSNCKYSKASSGASATDMQDVLPAGDENVLQQVVGGRGPVAVAVDGSGFGFKHYETGIFDSVECSSTDLTHGMLVVGYGTENSQDFWLIKNSWNTDWGLKGYMKMVRNRNNRCGIATRASYPVV